MNRITFLQCFAIFFKHFFLPCPLDFVSAPSAKSHTLCKFNLVFACLIAFCYILPESPGNLTWDTCRSYNFLPSWTIVSSNLPYLWSQRLQGTQINKSLETAKRMQIELSLFSFSLTWICIAHFSSFPSWFLSFFMFICIPHMEILA